MLVNKNERPCVGTSGPSLRRKRPRRAAIAGWGWVATAYPRSAVQVNAGITDRHESLWRSPSRPSTFEMGQSRHLVAGRLPVVPWKQTSVRAVGRRYRCEWIEDGKRCTKSAPQHHRLFADHVKERRDDGDPIDPSNGMCPCGSHHTIKA